MGTEVNFAGNGQPYFSRGRAGGQFIDSADLQLMQALVDLLDQMPNARDLLVRGTQAQFLLVLDALPKVKHGLQCEVECHESSARKRQQLRNVV